MTEVPAPYGRAALCDPSALSRVFEAAGCRTQSELADFLGVRQSSISDAKKRMAIPAEWLLKLLKKQGINPDWVRSGMGAQYLHPGEASAEILPNSMSRPSSSCIMQEFFFALVRRAMDGKKLT